MHSIILIRAIYTPTDEQLTTLLNNDTSPQQRASLLNSIPHTVPKEGVDDCTALNHYELERCLPVTMENHERLSLHVEGGRALLIKFKPPVSSAAI